MVIREIHIDGYGIFRDRSLTGLAKGLNLFTGENEAGKSTLLRFIRHTLFGYPRRLEQRDPPLLGGPHGGRIHALLADGREAVFERDGKNRIRLLLEGSETQDPALWKRLLGYTTADLFFNIYAITLDELVGTDTLWASGVEDKIHSLGMGLGELSLGEVARRFRAEAERYYKSSRGEQEINKLMNELQRLEEKIREVQQNMPRYRELLREIGDLEQQRTALVSQAKALEKEVNRLDHYARCYDHYVRYSHAVEDLDTLPRAAELPPDGKDRLDELERRIRELQERLREEQQGSPDEPGLDELEQHLAGIHFNEALTEEGEKVQYLKRNIEKYKDSCRDKEEAEASLEQLDRKVAEGLRQLGGGWDEERVKHFEEVLARRDRLREYGKRLEELAQQRTTQEAVVNNLLAQRRSKVNVAVLLDLFAGLLTLAAVPAFIYGYPWAGIVAVAGALLLFFGKKRASHGQEEMPEVQRLHELEQEEEDLRQEYTRYLGELRLPASLSPAAALEALDLVARLQQDLAERERLQQKITQKWDPFLRDFEAHTAALARMTGDNGPDVATLAEKIVTAYDKAVEKRKEKEQLTAELERKRRKVTALRHELKDLQEEMKALLEHTGTKDPGELRKKYQENARRLELERIRDEAYRNIETIAGIGKAGEVIRYLKEHDPGEVQQRLEEQKARLNEVRKELEENRKELGHREAERDRLAAASQLSQLMTMKESTTQRLNDAYRSWLANRAAIKVLEMMREQYEEEKQPAFIARSSEYFRRITGGRYEGIRLLLNEGEEKKRGKEEKELVVFDAHGKRKTLTQLSRGTREQLLIALRLGLIEEYERQSEPLPVIADEVLVNFDPARARHTAEVLRDFARDRQILFFTCHPGTGSLFREVFGDTAFRTFSL